MNYRPDLDIVCAWLSVQCQQHLLAQLRAYDACVSPAGREFLRHHVDGYCDTLCAMGEVGDA